MGASRPELADVVRKHGKRLTSEYGATLSSQQRRVLKAIRECRTAALGGHKKECDRCGHVDIAYNSCRNRHCPKCQAAARSKWMDARVKDLLEVEYFHVVFTLPAALGPLALQNKKLVYGLLFRAVKETLLTIARDPRHLGAEIGFLAVLHTWGQKLDHHPHVHCVVPGGGLALDGSSWIPCRKGFFLPVRVLSRLFRKKFLVYLREAFRNERLVLAGKTRYLRNQRERKALLRRLDDGEWVVYSKPPFGGPNQVLAYLARYTHRVAISNRRILSVGENDVQFSWKDYRKHQRRRRMSLEGVEFLRRFLQHVLPSGFQRIRHYGILSNRVRGEKLALCRELMDVTKEDPRQDDSDFQEGERDAAEKCPKCGTGLMLIVGEIAPQSLAVTFLAECDTS